MNESAGRQASSEPVNDKIYCICRKRESEDDDEVMMVGCEAYVTLQTFRLSALGIVEECAKLDVGVTIGSIQPV